MSIIEHWIKILALDLKSCEVALVKSLPGKLLSVRPFDLLLETEPGSEGRELLWEVYTELMSNP